MKDRKPIWEKDDEPVQEGEVLFDPPELKTPAEKEEEASFWFNKVGPHGYAPADFVYDPLSKKGFE